MLTDQRATVHWKYAHELAHPRVFTADVGTTPAKYVLHLRVEAARRLLQSSSDDLRHIARVVGFGSVDGMRRAFVRVLGKSPRDMRGSGAVKDPCCTR